MNWVSWVFLAVFIGLIVASMLVRRPRPEPTNSQIENRSASGGLGGLGDMGGGDGGGC
jgi:hypothetical protein